jgi:demethylmenaquinone methyltransferase/2-methoxy-6-polyprenyl-1,4-benzoquinol methylase
LIVLLQVHDGHLLAKRFFNSANALSYDSIVRFATFGQDFVWKKKILDIAGNQGSVLDLACGTGILSCMLAARSRSITGIDLTIDYLRLAKKKKSDLFLANGTAELLPYRSGCFDAVVSSYLAKYIDTGMVVQECWRVLRPNGVVVFHDFTYPAGIVGPMWRIYFCVLKLAGTFVRSWQAVFDGLDKLVLRTQWVEQTISALKSAGFENIKNTSLTGGTSAIVSAVKPSGS